MHRHAPATFLAPVTDVGQISRAIRKDSAIHTWEFKGRPAVWQHGSGNCLSVYKLNQKQRLIAQSLRPEFSLVNIVRQDVWNICVSLVSTSNIPLPHHDDSASAKYGHISHPDVNGFKPTALKLAKQWVDYLPDCTASPWHFFYRVRHRGPDWSESQTYYKRSICILRTTIDILPRWKLYIQ